MGDVPTYDKRVTKFRIYGVTLSVYNSYQYISICIDKRVRGTFVNQINPRSYEAHTRKLGLDIIQEF